MSDLFLGQTCTEAFTFIAPTPIAAHTFTFGFQPDKVVFNNLTAQTVGTTGLIAVSTWFRDKTAAGRAYQQVALLATGANFSNAAAPNGFTVADTEGGAPAYRANISAISMANPVAITTALAHGYSTGHIVRITDLGNDMPVPRGASNLNNKRYKIVVTSATAFTLQDPITGDPINGIGFEAYVSGGRVVLETREVGDPEAYVYDPITYQLTVGTAVMGTAGDQFYVEVYKFGEVTELGTLT